MRKRMFTAGFTLIELIAVILIIGILAKLAVPRFINQTRNSRVAAMNGLARTISATISLTRAQYFIDGRTASSTANTILINGTTVSVIAGTGRPAATAAGIGRALRSTSGFTPTYSGGVATYRFSNNAPTGTCTVRYTASTGAIAVTTTNC